ncbi:chemotaxis protein CheB [Flavobacterium sp.]|uniref:chemotaxis protein CheB n=1 Tax=Flavobacterium sp. TaxID=239 RepID=UPI0026051AE4|nr:chemotaxis protein CheB [Flavobacterium sp.]MDG2433695.1 chemotaxis protein CheB [Flavobacterium sp.]
MAEVILIGGSAGAFNCIISILKGIDRSLDIPIVVILHRLKNAETNFESILKMNTHYTVKEIEDKEPIQRGMLYTAPPDYHVFLEEDRTLSLDVSEAVNYSRPSIDVIFESFSLVLKEKCMGILLSGANGDGAKGLQLMAELNGTTVIQDCIEADFNNMPKAAKARYKQHQELTIENIIKLLNNEYK